MYKLTGLNVTLKVVELDLYVLDPDFGRKSLSTFLLLKFNFVSTVSQKYGHSAAIL